MKKRIYVGSLNQETNTFSPLKTYLNSFQQGYYLRGNEIKSRLLKTNSEIGGFYEVLNGTTDVEVVDGFAAWAMPSGRIEDITFEKLVNTLIDDIKCNLPLDGILLALHGSLVSETIDDCDGCILQQVKLAVGTNIPVVSTLDMHATVTKTMIDNSDILVGFRTYPHVDHRETGIKAATALLMMLVTGCRPHAVLERASMIFPIEKTDTNFSPMAEVYATLNDFAVDENVISSSIFIPQPWLDVCETGVSVLLYSKQLEDRQIGQALSILDLIWFKKNELMVRFPSIHEFLKNVVASPTPTIIVDSGDVTSGGAPGDSTEILRAFLNYKMPLKVALFIVDAQSVRHACAAGVGKATVFNLGGSDSADYNQRTQVLAEITNINENPFVIAGSCWAGVTVDPGTRVCLKINQSIDVIVSECAYLMHDPEALRSMGLMPEEYDVIVQKSHKMFRPNYKDIAKAIVILNTSGWTTQNLGELPYKKVSRPLYPLDQIQKPYIEQYIKQTGEK